MFNTMFANSKPDLLAALSWIGLHNISEKVDKETLISIFMNHIQGNNNSVTAFLDSCSAVTNNTLAKDKMYIYQKLAKYKGTRLDRSINGMYYFDKIEIGPDLKFSAENIAKNKDLVEVKGLVMDLK